MKLMLRFTTRQEQYLFRYREIEITDGELQKLIDQYLLGDDSLTVTASDLLDYLKVRGEFASHIELAGRHQAVEELLNGVAFRAFAQQPNCLVLSTRVFDNTLEQDVRFEQFMRFA